MLNVNVQLNRIRSFSLPKTQYILFHMFWSFKSQGIDLISTNSPFHETPLIVRAQHWVVWFKSNDLTYFQVFFRNKTPRFFFQIKMAHLFTIIFLSTFYLPVLSIRITTHGDDYTTSFVTLSYYDEASVVFEQLRRFHRIFQELIQKFSLCIPPWKKISQFLEEFGRTIILPILLIQIFFRSSRSSSQNSSRSFHRIETWNFYLQFYRSIFIDIFQSFSQNHS